jgi:hypothetical protein
MQASNTRIYIYIYIREREGAGAGAGVGGAREREGERCKTGRQVRAAAKVTRYASLRWRFHRALIEPEKSLNRAFIEPS